ncbi:filamentous hemagglutinin family protein [Bradyrhizobium sp. U87765 SZCCT0131]|nr:filamentous hemagglutinin family protein [Bradyrhizobium sp. U87765 SZCCT0131]MBR1260280.1 filamentous hemagglutinin family protein [Bradyrhizobium sp. U87765 SZCCT0134]MBR1307471.1 filamentous hemagglutinin family protein [Bradyrhizobium sp. U87765 SZCCT0110]MBR1321425.1 filamentous hemagglutinin family protein [Bradyrhizobium sp. U87765 SZCCT0109]MBR1349738.1 filamentous hemagglutinin family protein [Bradyrhizobium sp. U87765 SZCCT0048]
MSAQEVDGRTRSDLRRRILLAGASSLVVGLMLIGGDSRAATLNGANTPVGAPNIASDAAALAARQAAGMAQQTQSSLARAARALQDIQALQGAARAAAQGGQAAVTVPNGLAPGGLQMAPGAVVGSTLWRGAQLPTQRVDAAGQTQVGIRQTDAQAILNWNSFNVGARTTLTFDQQGNSGWVALNRIVGTTAPSQILGNIRADGQVYVINQNGIVFGGASQINVGALIASTAKITDQQFLGNGIYSAQNASSYVPSFTAAGGKVVVQAGASISTAAPSSVTAGGGFVLLLGSEVVNAGSIATPKGQALLAAGDDFILRRGYGTQGNQFSTTRGSEIAPVLYAGSASGRVANSGIVLSQQGDITLAGRTVAQDGVLISTTSVNQRGTIHLLNAATDAAGSVTLSAGSISAVLPEIDSADTALNSKRDALVAASGLNVLATGQFNNLSTLADRLDQSRVEVVTGGIATFQNGSLTMAQGGQVAVSAGRRVFAESGSTIDVSGVQGAVRPMSANQVLVNIQGNELRDSPQNRDGGALLNKDVWIDIRNLVLLPAGTGGYAGDRYYTRGGLLELGGYLANTAHTIGEWTAVGGTITLSAPEVVAQRGARFDISGGSVDYAGGFIRSSSLIGIDGRIYGFDDAPADMKFVAVAGGFVRTHMVQGKIVPGLTEIWTNMLGPGSSSRYEEGYTVGRDAGRLVLSSPTAVMEADVVADVITGQRQTSARAAALADGYKQTQTAVPLAGTLALGQYTALGRVDLFNTDVRIGTIADISPGMGANDAAPAGRANTAWFDAQRLSGYGLGRLEIGTRGKIAIESNLTLANGGALDLTAPVVDISARVTAHGGSVSSTNAFSSQVVGNVTLLTGGLSSVRLRQGAALDLSGLSTDLGSGPGGQGTAFVDGGSVSLQSTRDVVLEQGSEIDMSSGVVFLVNGALQGGRGGNATLIANLGGLGTNGNLVLGSTLRGYGLNGGGALSVQAGRVVVGGLPAPQAGTLVIDPRLFATGFGSYSITGNRGLAVADGTRIDVTMPVYRVSAANQGAANPAARLEVWTPPLYLENAATGVLTQRKGASLSLQAGSNQALASDLPQIGLTIGTNAVINVDAGQSIAIASVGQLTMDGALHASGGSISLKTIDVAEMQQDIVAGTPNTRSIWIGEHATLDVAAVAATALDTRGRRYGLVRNGGSIVVGGEIDGALGQATAASHFVVVRPGAVLDASGTAAVLDVLGAGAINVASNGGIISLASNNGLYLDGAMSARAGGAGAAGGSLNVALRMREYTTVSYDAVNNPLADPVVRAQRLVVLASAQGASVLAAGLQPGAADPALAYGYARLGADVVARGGFDNLSVMSNAIGFDGHVALHLGQSLNLYSDLLMPVAGSPQDARIALDAAYVRLAEANYATTTQVPGKSRVPVWTAPPARLDVHLDVAAKLIDVRDSVQAMFGLTRLQSDGDLRFLQGVRPYAPAISTSLVSPGSIILRAAQVYPGTGVVAQVLAGYGSSNGQTRYDPAQVLRVEAISAEAPALPYAVFGDLTLAAAVVEQAGVVRAPLGKLTIGAGGYEGTNTTRVTLLPGSVTSVSGRGLVMPYGGTIDGLSYLYNGTDVRFNGAGGVDVAGNSSVLKVGIAFGGKSAIVESGAIVDLSGGGDLTGAGFISGRGGSVDVLRTAFRNANPAYRFSAAGNAVYAIVPNFRGGYAPIAADAGAGNPLVGRQITLDGSVPGLPAGTYTLMPSTYALLPGAFRIEIGAAQSRFSIAGAMPVSNGSYVASGRLGFANTAIQDSLASAVVLTPANAVRSTSQYNETSYASYIVADAVKLGVPRAMLPVDARSLLLNLNPGAGAAAFRFNGTALFDALPGGYGGSVMATTASGGGANIEVVAAGGAASTGFAGVTLDSAMLNALGASRLVIGGMQYVQYGQGGRLVDSYDSTPFVYLRRDALLSAPEVVLMANGQNATGNGIVVEQGARINTIGKGAAAYDARDGYVYATNGSYLMVSNGVLDLVPSSATANAAGNRGVRIGVCDTGNCGGQTEIYSEGTIAVVTPNQFQMDEAVRYGTRNLTLAVSRINLGDSAVLADAAARNVLPSGLAMNQSLLDRLLRGDTRYGAPALQTLTLSASNAVNIFGSVTLDTIDPATGKSTLANLVLGTPAIYGAGTTGDVATIRTGNFIWRGSTATPGEIVASGAGTGAGTLNVEAERIVFGYGANSRPSGNDIDGRLVLGFANVNLSATDRVTANQKGTLSVYQSRGAYVAGQGYSYSGGNLTITAPLVTGEGGSVNSITAGGALRLAGAGSASEVKTDTLGAQLTLTGNSLTLDTSIVLPSGKLALKSAGDIILTGASRIDMAGREVAFNDVRKYSWGGEVTLDSSGGNIRQAAGSVIDLSARNNNAGSLTAIALDAAAGLVDLQGAIIGTTSGRYDAGGTLVPYRAGSATVRAQSLGDFAALNVRLTAGGVFGARSFQIKQGDLTIGNELKASEINVSLDNGLLTVAGTIDASGERVGTIRLAAKRGLTLTGTAVLDAHGTVLRVDSYGKIIDSPNRAIVELSSGDGRLTLAQGARIDLRHGTNAPIGTSAGQNDGRARGTLDLNAPRIGSTGRTTDADAATYGDIDIDVSGMPNIQGARTINVNAMQSYDDAPTAPAPAASGRPYQVIDQAWLDSKHTASTTFINAALARGSLTAGKLAGLNNATYRDAFHLRPGIEVVSKLPGGDLVVQGDLDLSGYRYASLNPNSRLTGIYGSGEAGTLTLRAGGDLAIYGSITDGFMPPPDTQDDKGWLLLPGKDFTGGDVYIPRTGVVLADGSRFSGGKTLNYDLPIKASNFAAGTVIPVDSALSAPLQLVAGTVLSANVRDAAGNILFAAGTIVGAAITLPTGTRFDAGMTLPAIASLAALTWPKGIALPGTAAYVLNGALTLPYGAYLPSNTDIKLPDGVASVDLRPGAAGKLWALAKMLPEGSQSWSLRLVAGADTRAADNRLTDPHAAHGDILLADRHYGLFGKSKPGGALVWTQEGVDGWGDPNDTSVYVGAPIDEVALGWVGMCGANPTWCTVKPVYTWTQAAADELTEAGIPGVVAGAVITDKFFRDLGLDLTAAGYCTDTPSHCLNTAKDTFEPTAGSTRFSVARTGAADFELLAARNLNMSSLFGVYTAGTSSTPTSAGDPYNLPRARNAQGKVLGDADGAYEKFVDGGAASLARAWYPTGGGNLTIRAGGNLTGDLMTLPVSGGGRPNASDSGYNSAAVGNWLWRQGTGTMLGGSKDQATAWWINFGSYVNFGGADKMVGFTGFGTLGGGDLRVEVGGDAGILAQRTSLNDQQINQRTQGLVLAVGSTGRVGADGSLTLTGGGDLDVRVGGALNPAAVVADALYNGVATNLRGSSAISAGSVGLLQRIYGNLDTAQSPRETRAYDLFRSSRADVIGGLSLTAGDSVFTLASGGDLVISGVSDPGRASAVNATPFVRGSDAGSGNSWFSLWTGHTAINLFSAGGDLVPFSLAGNVPMTDSGTMYPSILTAVAAGGSLYYGNATAMNLNGTLVYAPLLLAPSAAGKLEFLAADSIYAGGFTVARSSASSLSLATPFNPAFFGTITATGANVSNLSATGNQARPDIGINPLFAFGPNTATADGGNGDPARFYAVNGDLIGVGSGRIVTFAANDPFRAGQVWYQGAGPVRMMAGRDIVGSGTAPGVSEDGNGGYYNSYFSSTGNLFVHQAETDVSLVQAGRDIVYSSFNVGGPGTLQLSAGRNVLMENKASVTSLGPVVAGDARPGAGIVVQAGAGARGPDYAALLRYLDPANALAAGLPLEGSGKVARTYEKELAAWLQQRYGFVGSDAAARSYFGALAPDQQQIFLREVYFAELTAGGREYNDSTSTRYRSYLRGRDAIAALFPDATASGDITMFGGSGVRTLFGGDIQLLTPGGKLVIGTEGIAPPATAGVTTQGSGNVQIYARGSVLLGLSRIMTTFGGNIIVWSANGDINAGRGAKTTVLYTPPRRLYDNYGNVSLAPQAPSSGAGIATLNPIPEVKVGDIDLIAPLGTIDAGEAGIRVSGNINLAALQIVNAANIQVQGTSSGIPTVQAPNLSIALAATNATAATQQTAAPATSTGGGASVIMVEVLGYGGGGDDDDTRRRGPSGDRQSRREPSGYDPDSKFQVIGNGDLSERQKRELTEGERERL